MNTHIASPERVARSWLLEKLLGPEKPKGPSKGPSKGVTPPPRARSMTDREREQVLDGAYEHIKSEVIRAMKMEFRALDQAEQRIAKRHGIDPLFLNWYVVNGTNWPSMPERTKKGLRTMQSARLWFGEVPSNWTNMHVPELDDARSRDAALKELGDWFIKNFATKVERKFTNAIWTKSRELLDVFKGRRKGSKAKASVLLMRDFKKRLGGDRFQLKPAVRRLVELFG